MQHCLVKLKFHSTFDSCRNHLYIFVICSSQSRNYIAQNSCTFSSTLIGCVKTHPLAHDQGELPVKFNAASTRADNVPLSAQTVIFAFTMALNCSAFSRLILGAHTAAEACAKRAVRQTCGRYRVCRWYSSITHEENRLEQVFVPDSSCTSVTTAQVR